MGVADHELDPAQAALFERDQELAPEALVFAVANLEAEQLAPAVSIDAHGHDDGPGADLQGLAQAAVEVKWYQGRRRRNRPRGACSRRPAPARRCRRRCGLPGIWRCRSVRPGLPPGHHLPRRDAPAVGLHDDAVEGLIHPAAGPQDRGQVAACAQLGDHQVDVADLGGEQARPVAIAVAETIVTALVALGAEHGSNLQLDQLLQAVAHDLRDELPGRAAIE